MPLTPSNEQGWKKKKLVLIDLGAAKEAGQHTEEIHLWGKAGTLTYVAPELLDLKASLASDL